MKKLLILFLIAGCSKLKVPEPNIYPSSCPFWDKACERRFDAETLKEIGQDEAAKELMCLDKHLQKVLTICSKNSFSLY